MSLNPGARLGPYDVISVLGEGGMGEVYLDVAPDGRFLFIKSASGAQQQIMTIQNWDEELKARVPGAK